MRKREEQPSLYDTLHVERTASGEDISRAYRVLAAELHPDASSSSGDSARFRALNDAYRVLSNPETRRLYDAEGLAAVLANPDEQFSRGFHATRQGTSAQQQSQQQATTMGRLAQRVKDSQTVDFPQGPESFDAWLQRSRQMSAGNTPQVFDVAALIERNVVPVVNYERVPLPVHAVGDVPCVAHEIDRVFAADAAPEKLLAVEHQRLPADLDFGHVVVAWTLVPVTPGDLLELRGVAAPTDAATAGVGQRMQMRTRVAGNEGVGVVRRVGAGVQALAEGDMVVPRVLGLGTWRPLAIYRESQLIKLPKTLADLDLHQLASLRELIAAYRMLEDFVELSPGDTVMQTAGNGTVAQAVTQMCRTLRVNTISVVRSQDKALRERLRELGATVVVDNSEPLWPAIREARIPEPRLVLDCVGGNLTTTVAAAADGATLVIYGGVSLKQHQIPTGRYLYNDLRVRGFLLQRLIQNDTADAKNFIAAAEQIALLLRAHRLDVDADIRVFDPERTDGVSPRAFWAQAVTDTAASGRLRKIFVKMPDLWTSAASAPAPTLGDQLD